jgi:hypothetical protein
MSNLFQRSRVYSQPGAKLYFDATGTSDPQPTYQDEELETEHAYPVVADGEGYFAPIYLNPALPNYRYTLKTSAEAIIEGPIDDVRTSTESVGSFTGVLTGVSGSATGTVYYQRVGKLVYLHTIGGGFNGTSNANTLTMTGLPVSLRPANESRGTNSYVLNQNTGTLVGATVLGNTVTFGTVDLSAPGFPDEAGFNSSGAKGIPPGWFMLYPLD